MEVRAIMLKAHQQRLQAYACHWRGAIGLAAGEDVLIHSVVLAADRFWAAGFEQVPAGCGCQRVAKIGVARQEGGTRGQVLYIAVAEPEQAAAVRREVAMTGAVGGEQRAAGNHAAQGG